MCVELQCFPALCVAETGLGVVAAAAPSWPGHRVCQHPLWCLYSMGWIPRLRVVCGVVVANDAHRRVRVSNTGATRARALVHGDDDNNNNNNNYTN